MSAGFVDWFTDLFNIGEGGNNLEGELASLSPSSENQDLIAYYSFEYNVNDVSGNGNNGVNNGVSFVEGRVGKAGSFDGSDYIDVGNLNSNVQTISFWINSDYLISSNSAETALMQYGVDAGQDAIVTGPVTGFIRGETLMIMEGSDRTRNYYRTAMTQSISTGWHFLTFVWSSVDSKYDIYIDGIKKITTSGEKTNTPLANFEDFSIGGGDNSYYSGFEGKIDELKLWNRALSESEILEEYNYEEGCIEDWSCTSWSDCINEEQTRTCTEDNNCGTINNKPVESQSCTNVSNCTDSDGGKNYYVKGYLSNSDGGVISSETGRGNDVEIISDTQAKLLIKDIWYLVDLNEVYDLSIGKFIVSEINVSDARVTLDYLKIYDDCSSDEELLFEKICVYGDPDYLEYFCEGGCLDGACNPEANEFETIEDWIYADPSLVEMEITSVVDLLTGEVLYSTTEAFIQIGRTIIVQKEDKDLVPGNLKANVTKPDGTKETIILNKRESNCYCYDNECYFEYIDSYVANNSGVYSVEDENINKIGYFKVVEQGYFKESLILDENLEYSSDFSGSYTNNYEPKIRLHAYYFPQNEQEDSELEVEILRYENEGILQEDLEEFLGDFPREIISSSQEVEGNLVYTFKDIKHDEMFILWKSDKNLIFAGKHRSMIEENISIREFLQSLSGNLKKEYVSLNYYDFPTLFKTIIKEYLEIYPSDFEGEECYSYWACETKPLICPPHGVQIKTCRDDSDCNKNEVIKEITCQPGICAGCLIPKWMGYSHEDDICVPYGTRLAYEEKDNGEDEIYEGIYQDSQGGLELEVISSREAKLRLFNNLGFENTYYLRPNNQVKIIFPKYFEENPLKLYIKDIIYSRNKYYEINVAIKSEDGVSITIDGISKSFNKGQSGELNNLKVYIKDIVNLNTTGLPDYIEVIILGKEIILNNNETKNVLGKNYVLFTLIERYNAYCNYDGKILKQKTVDYQGNWAKCQNNYECESNICSSGECIEITKMMDEMSRWKVFLTKLVCRFGHLFSIENYNQCISEKIGEDYLNNQAHSGNGGNSGSSGGPPSMPK